MHALFSKELPTIETEAVAVIYAGGSGSRLWPISSPDDPKQINSFFEPETMLRTAFDRAREMFPPERIVIVTTEKLRERVQAIVPVHGKNLVVQPDNAETTVAFAFTAMHLDIYFPESVAVSFFTDHIIDDLDQYRQAIQAAVGFAKQNEFFMTLGTVPTAPKTELGYIELGSPLPQRHLFRGKAFREKPDASTAQEYVDSKRFVWNTGLFIWPVKVLLALMKEHVPQVYDDLVELRAAFGSDRYEYQLQAWFASLPTQQIESFERSVAEHLDSFVVYVADYNWRDIGNWESFYETVTKDGDGNAVFGEFPDQKVILDKSEGCLVIPSQRKVAVVGMKDVIVVQTDDSLLICPRSMAAEVKNSIQPLMEPSSQH